MTKTKATKLSNIKRFHHKLDAKGKILGNIAVDVAKKLIGKSKAYFVYNLDCGDYVTVTNAKYVQVTGKKKDQKIYTRYSGYPSGLRKETFAELIERQPEEVIRHAVFGMLPKNKLRNTMIKRLTIYPEEIPSNESIKEEDKEEIKKE